MKMPWSVRIALGWFVLLAVGCCAILLSLQGMWFCEDFPGVDWMLWEHAACIGYIALTVGFVAAILRGRRRWVTIPYCLFGLAVVVVLTGSEPVPPLVPGMPDNLFVAAVVLVTAVPILQLHLPSANRWFAAFPRQKGLGVGCCTLLVLAIAGMMASMVDVGRPQLKMDAAQTAAMSIRGRNVFRLLMLNEIERTERKDCGVDVTACTNSWKLVEELCEVFEDKTGLASRAGEWSFAVNLPPDALDTFPLMISANVDPSVLPREWDGETDKDKRLDLPPLECVEPLRFGNRAIVIVRKNGVSQVIKRKYMTLGTIFGDKAYKLGEDTYFLTPVGKRKAGAR